MKSLKIFKNKAFMRFAMKAGISDASLCKATRDAERGLIAADLGGSVIKQRIARPGQGKSSGFRTLIVFRANMRAFFVHRFAKSEKDNIGEEELIALKKLASELLAYDEKALNRAVASGTLTEVGCDEKTIQ
jgi:hypothetical protein